MTISTANKTPMEFPLGKLTALEEKISNHRWVVPVLPDQELEVLLDAAIAFASDGRDVNCAACQRFYRNGLTVSFTKILTDEAVTSWKLSIQQCIRVNCERLVKLCALRMDSPYILNLLAILFNPNNKFHSFNAGRQSETVPNDVVYARPQDHRNPRGWLVDLINRFGHLNGFERVAERFEVIAGLKQSPSIEEATTEVSLSENDPKTTNCNIDAENESTSEKESPEKETTPTSNNKLEDGSKESLGNGDGSKAASALVAIWQLIRPFSLCHELLTPFTVNKYLTPILEAIPAVLERLTDEELKSDARVNESKTDTMSCLIRACRNLATKATQNPNLSKGIEMFRLKMILRLLQMPSFNGKMSALSEVNQVIGSVLQQSKPDWLTPATIAQWIRENNVLEIVLRDSLHQQQYVERLEKMLRFMIKEGALTPADLDAIWGAQHGKHEAIVKNVHDLLAKLAWDFTPEQLDHLFDCFKASWSTSSKKQSDKLLEVIRRLAEDDKDGVMAHKVLVLFWNLAHSEEICTDVMDVALANHVKILDYSCCQDRDAQKILWLDKCVEELKSSERWALPALKHMQEICCLYEAGQSGMGGGPPSAPRPSPASLCRQAVIERLHNQHSLVILVTNSLTSYMEHARAVFKQQPDLDWDTWLPDGRYPHVEQVQERLGFLSFLLKDGQLWLCAEQAKQIWVCLAERGVSPEDREACFRWFSKLMGEEPDLDPTINLQFFKQNILTLDPRLLTYSGIQCFERFFKAVNGKEGKLKMRRKGFQLEEPDLIGLDYLWRVICECTEEIAMCGVELIREVCASPGIRLASSDYHEAFINDCCERLRVAHQGLSGSKTPEQATVCCVRLFRVLRVITEYVVECDRRYAPDRQILPLYRAGRGRQCDLIVRFQAGQRQLEDMELYTHSHEILHVLRTSIYRRISPDATGIKLELYINGELLDQCHDNKLLSEIPIRHKSIITGKVSASNIAGQSSNDSSSDSSTGELRSSVGVPASAILSSSLQHFSENFLPGAILAQGEWQIPFILELEQTGCDYHHPPLRDTAHQLTHILPPHQHTVDKLSAALVSEDDTLLHQMLYGPPPPNVAYNVKVLYSMVIPAMEPLSERWHPTQLACVRHGHLFLDAITSNAFLQGGAPYTRRGGILHTMKLVKLVLTALGHFLVLLDPETSNGTEGRENVRIAEILQKALYVSPSHTCEIMVKAVAEKLARSMGEQVLGGDANQSAAAPLLLRRLPSQATIRAAGAHALASAHTTVTSPARHPAHLHADDIALVREALEVVTVCVALNGANIAELLREAWLQNLLVQLIIVCPNPQVRVCCAEQLLEMCGWSGEAGASAALATLLAHTGGAARVYASRSNQYFQLLCRLIAAAGTQVALPLLSRQVAWLKATRDSIIAGHQVEDTLLEGHLSLTKEIFILSSSDIKCEYGSDPAKDINLIRELVCEFLWPCSWAQLQMSRGVSTADSGGSGMPTAICTTPGAIAAACDLLASLCHRCVPNMSLLVTLLTNMFYSDSNSALTEWEYLPAVGPRSTSGLVGLRNAGATCYMNSILQQLYMVPSIRDHLLKVQGAVTDPNEDFSGEDHIDFNSEENIDYNVCILKQVQAIFAHLHYSKLQYYIPRGLWANFKLLGEPVNLREQQDAVEFFMSLVESLDEALKTLGQEQLMAKTLGGSFSDQKICKGCPHRYCKEEPFSVVSLDIRNMSRLQESLEAYVRGELLEGADAYQCDKCNKKVVTVKRLCLNKLPPVLGIQLKRFEYDFDKVCAMKFNDYFEFPRELDVEPYTVWGLAKAEGDDSMLDSLATGSPMPNTKYNLTGIVVHSGQASGGHYYSFILHRDSSGNSRWLKFDDADVSECAMQDDEEMKAQCFGGDYMGEVFDQMSKRLSFRRQKRWWNAYMLFYTREDCLQGYMLEHPMSCLSLKDTGVPSAIWDCVRRSNIAFSHHQGQFSPEYFSFMKKLCCMRLCVIPTSPRGGWDTEQEKLSMLCVKLATKFLFNVGFRTKKTLRGPASDWSDILLQHLRCSPAIRAWFAVNAMFQHSHRMCEYLLACPSPEVRVVFMKLAVFLAHFSVQDPPVSGDCVAVPLGRANLSEQLLAGITALATTRDPSECKQLPLLFNFFLTYLSLGLNEKFQLIKLNVVYLMVSISIDESIQIANKFQYSDLIKLHQVVSLLVRCCDVSSRCQSSDTSSGATPLPNPFGDPLIAQAQLTRPALPSLCADILFNKTTYIKKLIEESNGCDETVRLVQFLAWENPLWSKAVLSELLWQITYAYSNDLRHNIDILLALLLLEDSWQTYRVLNAIKGEDKEGLLDNIVRSRCHYQKRAYQCIKLLVAVFTRSPAALRLLQEQKDLRQRWNKAIAWLQDEIHSRYSSSNYNYNTWSPPGTINENSGYFLERSNSAKKTLDRAYQLFPDEDDDEASCSDREVDPVESESSKETKIDVDADQIQTKLLETVFVRQSDGTTSQVAPASKTLTEITDQRLNSGGEDDLTSSDGSVTNENV
ncbi:ubiquitin carboxyl-terminal hydrolase-like faf isoform X2 [Arctopsyche grandis]|uniref:ubiquitin carboxyl-terminal hydrolase-like faf isoform X2 n=1 Tax=Arctopsyche grandis TaxID=121162 RepID=UPI00406D81F4